MSRSSGRAISELKAPLTSRRGPIREDQTNAPTFLLRRRGLPHGSRRSEDRQEILSVGALLLWRGQCVAYICFVKDLAVPPMALP